MGLGKLPAVGSRLGLTPERFLGLMARAFRLGSLSSLRNEPHGRLLEANQGQDFLGQRVVTDDGLVNLAPVELVEAVRNLEATFEQERTQRHKLKLISKREQHSHNSWLHNHSAFRRRETLDELPLHEPVGWQDGWGRVGRDGRGPQQCQARSVYRFSSPTR